MTKCIRLSFIILSSFSLTFEVIHEFVSQLLIANQELEAETSRFDGIYSEALWQKSRVGIMINSSLKCINGIEVQIRFWGPFLNPLSAIVHYTVHGNLTFFIVLDPKEVPPRRVATHAPLCNTLPSNNLSPKTVKDLKS